MCEPKADQEQVIQDENAMILKAIGAAWRACIPPEYHERHAKYADRKERVRRNMHVIRNFLPEFMHAPNRRILDVSCGAGMFLEIMRHYGHAIHGLDWQYFLFLESQAIPYIDRKITAPLTPLPFDDATFDLVTCMHAISAYYPVGWEDTITELCRLSKHAVFLACNPGEHHTERQLWLEQFSLPGWRQVPLEGPSYKWVRNQ